MNEIPSGASAEGIAAVEHAAHRGFARLVVDHPVGWSERLLRVLLAAGAFPRATGYARGDHGGHTSEFWVEYDGPSHLDRVVRALVASPGTNVRETCVLVSAIGLERDVTPYPGQALVPGGSLNPPPDVSDGARAGRQP
ncbi:MAG: hypothetical protein HYZ53_26010 [Planctomycetes bacterium]|nr:hypothetical protein [Planctomycetota bacterium]